MDQAQAEMVGLAAMPPFDPTPTNDAMNGGSTSAQPALRLLALVLAWQVRC